MNQRTDNERLLEDVLAGETGDSSREVSLSHVLQLARRRRRNRLTQRIGGAVFITCVIGIAVLRNTAPTKPKPEMARGPQTPASYEMVVSRPLPLDQIVTTYPLSPEQIVTSVEPVSVVQTVSGNFREVGDDELLTLALPRIAVLVRRGPHETELVLVSEPDANQN